MKKRLLVLGMLLCLAVTGKMLFWQEKTQEASVYFVDQDIQRLIPMDYAVPAKKPEKAARLVLRELSEGRRNNPKIMRLFPDVKNGVTVKVKNQTAYVNLSREFVENHSPIRQHELLTVYSIVNSLTSIDGIVNVKFTIDGKEEKNFKGFIDMREAFIPDYFM